MQKNKTAAAFTLFMFLAAATPSFAMVNRDNGQDPGGAPTPIQLIVKLIKKIVRPFEAVIVPRP